LASGTTFSGHAGGGPGNTTAVFQAGPGRTAAAVAALENSAPVERRAMAMAENREDPPS
jgi:hypothetical protein